MVRTAPGNRVEGKFTDGAMLSSNLPSTQEQTWVPRLHWDPPALGMPSSATTTKPQNSPQRISFSSDKRILVPPCARDVLGFCHGWAVHGYFCGQTAWLSGWDMHDSFCGWARVASVEGFIFASPHLRLFPPKLLWEQLLQAARVPCVSAVGCALIGGLWYVGLGLP